MRGWTCIVWALISGCNFHANGASDDSAIDGRKDAVVDMMLPDVPSNCVGTGSVRICPMVAPTQDLNLTTQTINTDTSPLCVAFTSQPTTDACVVAGRSIAIANGTAISAIGSRPLVLLSTTLLGIDAGGTIDVSSLQPSNVPGAGGDSPLCSAGTDGAKGGGGWGGSFGGQGGDGGTGPGTAGAAATAAPGFHGGCAGGVGAGTNPGLNGHGGGAVFLIAKTTIEIDGTINASGSGGAGGITNTSGAGGGGSGGLIGIDGGTVTIGISAEIFANGGGGGEGSGISTLGAAGGASIGPTIVGAGGAGNSTIGGDGGAGSAGATVTGSPGANGGSGGGGGGGGGAGVVKIYPPTTVVPTGVISPPAS